MSLEQRITELTEAVVRLTNVLQSQGAAAPASTEATNTAAPAADKPARATRKAKETPAAETATQPGSSAASTTTAAVNDGRTLSIKLRAGDPEGTRYFHIEQHNTVAAVKPGEPVPSIPGTKEIDGDEYDTLKAKYASALVPEGNGATAAPATSNAANASADAQASSQPGIDGPAVMEIFKKLHARDGNDGLRKALDDLGVKLGAKVARVGDLVADSSKHAVAYAFADALLNPKTEAAPAASVDLF